MAGISQENWYKPVDIGQHYLNIISDKEINSESIADYFQNNADIYNEAFISDLRKRVNDWTDEGSEISLEKLQDDPYFSLIAERMPEYAIAGFSDEKVNVIFFFTYGASRYHRYNVLLESLVLPRNELLDSILNLKHYDDIYRTEYKGIKHGSTMMEVESILGDDYYEYMGQSLQLRNIYYGDFDTELCIQDGIVKYISAGKPSWMESDLIRKNEDND